ncbi:MAG: DUF1588 domain-containing protein [Planctomycetales bacterium]
MEAEPVATYRAEVAPLLEKCCVECHSGKSPEGELSLPSLPGDPHEAEDLATWKKVFEQLESSVMPPIDAEQPTLEQRLKAMDWIRRTLQAAGAPVDESKARASERGNWVDHTALFSGKTTGDAATPSRVWRITDGAYDAYIQRLSEGSGRKLRDVTPPWRLPAQWSFPDYSTAHRVGEPEIEVHLRSSARIAEHLVSLFPKKREFAPLADVVEATDEATPEQIQSAVAFAFDFLLARKPDDVESRRYASFLTQSVKTSGEKGMEHFLTVVLSHPSVFYRIEKPEGGKSRGMPAPRDLARSISLALTDRGPDPVLAEAAASGKLATREEVREQVARILADHAIAKPRVVRFFREYFGYDPAPEVFKDEATQKAHGVEKWEPTFFVTDADRLIGWVLATDKEVLRTLLTTNKTFLLTYDERTPTKAANYFNRRFARKPPETPLSDHHVRHTLAIYEVHLKTRGDWSPDRPYDMPPEHRMGMLTHPAWLVAHSGNFDNHAIHRGRWIRERLLGGRIPDVPITVNAMLPDEPRHTLRHRMRVVREEYCWNCHQRMDPLGLPFEQFDHFGRFRAEELVLDREATEAKANRNKDGRPRRSIYKQVPLDTSGNVAGSLDPRLNGPVKDPFELIRKLADSELVEQVFTRHAFRFFMGRNETLADGPVLTTALRAYKENGGSMRALITSLLTSDSFLYRTHPDRSSTAADQERKE